MGRRRERDIWDHYADEIGKRYQHLKDSEEKILKEYNDEQMNGNASRE